MLYFIQILFEHFIYTIFPLKYKENVINLLKQTTGRALQVLIFPLHCTRCPLWLSAKVFIWPARGKQVFYYFLFSVLDILCNCTSGKFLHLQVSVITLPRLCLSVRPTRRSFVRSFVHFFRLSLCLSIFFWTCTLGGRGGGGGGWRWGGGGGCLHLPWTGIMSFIYLFSEIKPLQIIQTHASFFSKFLLILFR